MKVSVSFLNSNDVRNDLIKLDKTDLDYIHVDIMDGRFVRNKTMPFSEMKNIYKYTSKRLEVHLMVEDPEKYIPLYAELNTEYIIIHLELDRDIKKLLEQIKSYSIKAGISIKPNTPISALVPYLPFVDEVLVMSVEPGAGGQPFIEETEERIKELKALIKEYNFNVVINVDGGVNGDTVKMCKNCDIVTSGSYVIKSDDFQEKISSLR